MLLFLLILRDNVLLLLPLLHLFRGARSGPLIQNPNFISIRRPSGSKRFTIAIHIIQIETARQLVVSASDLVSVPERHARETQSGSILLSRSNDGIGSHGILWIGGARALS